MIAVATALTFAWTSCEKPAPEPTPGPDQPGNTDTPGGNENQGTEIKEITAVLEGATSKTAWAEGDAILVYAVVDGADVSAKYILTDAAAGKFVPSAKALPAGATGYFATYPYNEDLSFAMHNTFSFTLEAEQAVETPLFAYAEDAANLKFGSSVGAVKFSLTGKGGVAKIELADADSKAILNGNATYNPKTTQFTVKNAAASKYMVTKVLAEKVELGDTPVDFVVEVPAGTLKTGGVLTLYDVNNLPFYTYEFPAQTIEKGQVAAIATEPVVPVAQTVNLNSAQGYANTYQIPSVGTYKFEPVKGNDSSAKLDAASVEITWETWCTSEAVTPNSLVKSVVLEDGFVVVETADPYHAGNALISAKNAEGTIIWSWMLWFVEGKIGTVEYDGQTVMDRNLGALTADVDKPGLNYGLLWQWGRIAPLMGLDESYSGTPMASSPADVSNQVQQSESGTNFTIDYAIANPTVFLYGNIGDNGQRFWGPVTEAESALWAETKTIYDPCPAGYQVMTYISGGGIFSGLADAVVDETNKGITINGAWFPYAGWWKYSSGSRGNDKSYYWTTSQVLRNEELGYWSCANYANITGLSQSSYESKGDAMSIRCELTVLQ
jgi:hypothetical protein